MPRVVFISDTHLAHEDEGRRGTMPEIPGGDILVHAGDLTFEGSYYELLRELSWLAALPHRHKVVIAGNHDFLFEKNPESAQEVLVKARECLPPGSELVYLQDSEAEVQGLRIWGSPWTPRFYDWAFQLDHKRPDSERPFLLKAGYKDPAKHWAQIPDNLDILVTHGPPLTILDRTPKGDRVGDPDLLAQLNVMGAKGSAPMVHVFGHIHHQGGTVLVRPWGVSINASFCNESYRPSNRIVVVEI